MYHHDYQDIHITVHTHHIQLNEYSFPQLTSLILAAASEKYLLTATRTEVILYRIESSSLTPLYSHHTVFDVSAISVVVMNETPIYCICEWVNNTVSLYQENTLVQTLSFQSCIYSILLTLIPSNSLVSLYLMISHIDGIIRVFNYIDLVWKEEKSFHITNYAGTWIPSSDPSTLLLAGSKSCFLYRKNASWLYV